MVKSQTLFKSTNVESQKENSADLGVLNDVGFSNSPNLKVFPNPFVEDVTVSFGEQEKVLGKISYKISDLTGRVLGKKSSNDRVQNFYLKTLPPGVYILEINTGYKVYTRRIIRK